MRLESRYINYKGNQIHYLLFGEGEELLFCFHGFNESAELFLILEPSLSKRFKIIAIDLPLHGKTQWNKEIPFLKADLKNLLSLLLAEYSTKKFSLMGFSMGGKMVTTAVTQFPGQVQNVFLISPDGLKKSFWYSLLVYPKWGRSLFRHLIEHPDNYFRLISFLRSMRLIPLSLHQFLFRQLETKERRQKVFDTWVTIKDFDTDIKEVRQILNQYSVKLFLFFGKFDSVIKPKYGCHFVKGVKQYQLKIIPKGHNLMKDYLNEAIDEALSKS